MKAWLALLLIAFSAHAEEVAWTKLARQMGRSEAARREAVRQLSKRKELPKQLRAALNTSDKYLALEVITALGVKETLPDLERLADRDENGAIHLTLAALLDEKNLAHLEKVFHERLMKSKSNPVPVVLQVILLDTLSRMGTKLDDGLILSLFNSSNAYVREATLEYVRSQQARGRKPPGGIVYEAKKDPSERVRALGVRLEAKP